MEDSIISKSQSKMNSFLICPHCKQKQISIIDLTPQNTIIYQCPCSNFNYEDSIASFISKIESKKTEDKVCFKHKDQIAQIFCKDCNYYMCKLCDSFHSSFQPNHICTSLSNGFHSDCIQHKTTPNEFFCLTCNVELCKQCNKDNHPNHEVIELKDFYAKISAALPYKSLEDYIRQCEEEFNAIDKEYQKHCDSFQIIQEYLDLSKQTLKEAYNQLLENNTNAIIMMGILYSNYFRNKEIPNCVSLMNINKVYSQTNVINSSNTYGIKQTINCYNANNGNYIFNPTNPANNLTGRPTSFSMGVTSQSFYRGAGAMNKIEEINKHLLALKEDSLNYFKQHKITLKSNPLSFPLRNRIRYSKKYNLNFQIKTSPIQNAIELYTHSKKINLMLELPNRRIAISSEDQTVIILGQNSNNQFDVISKSLSHQHGVVTALCLLDNGNLISGTSNTAYGKVNTFDPIREWNLNTFECVKIISSIQNKIAAITQINNQLIAVALASLDIQIVNITTGVITKTLTNSLINSKLLAMLPNGDLISVSQYDKRRQLITIWNIDSGKIVKTIEKNSISTLYLIPNKRIVFNEVNKIVIYDLGKGIEEKNMNIVYTDPIPVTPNQPGIRAHAYGGNRPNEPPANEIISVCLLGLDKIIVGYGTHFIEIWDIEREQKETIMLFSSSKIGMISMFNKINFVFVKTNTICLCQI